MANVLNNEKKQQILALAQLGWSLRRIQQATRVRRETISTYLKAAGVGVWPPGGWGRQAGSKPAIGVTTGFGVELSGRRTGNPGLEPDLALEIGRSVWKRESRTTSLKFYERGSRPRSQRNRSAPGNGVPFASQGIGEQSAKTGAGTGDENHLLGIHDHPSLWRYGETSLMPEVKRLVTKMNSSNCRLGK